MSSIFKNIFKASDSLVIKNADSVAKGVLKSDATSAIVKSSLKNTSDIASTAAKAASKNADTAAKAALKDSDTVAKSALKTTGDDLAQNAVKSTGRETAQSASKKALDFVKKNPKMVVGGAAAGVVTGYALKDFLDKNGKKLGITKMEAYGGGLFSAATQCKITYTPKLKFCPSDKVDIKGTNCEPALIGTYPIAKILSETEIVIDKLISKPGTTGTLTVQTSFEAQMGQQIGEAIGGAVDVASDVVGGAIDGAMTSMGLPSLTSLVGPYMQYAKIAIVVIFCLFLLKVLLAVKSLFPKSKDTIRPVQPVNV
jgi:ElaB/YqjD/DUF883 family membrane-anchored ribosome-binding protein